MSERSRRTTKGVASIRVIGRTHAPVFNLEHYFWNLNILAFVRFSLLPLPPHQLSDLTTWHEAVDSSKAAGLFMTLSSFQTV